jgi:teichuronic acid biosynthesis glycosyltransferase TuaC
MIRLLSVELSSTKVNHMVFTQRQNSALKNKGVLCESFSLLGGIGIISFFRQIFYLQKKIKNFKPDIINAQFGSYTSFVCSFFSLKHKYIITFRGSDLFLKASIKNTNVIRGFMAHVLSQYSSLFAHRVICVSEKLSDHLWFAKHKSVVISDGVDLELFAEDTIPKARKILNIPTNSKVLLFNAGYNPLIKRKDIADHVASILGSRISDFKYIVLDGNIRPNLVPVYLQAANCLIVTSDSEGGPIIVKEALACNLPIVSVEVGDVVYMLNDVEECIVVAREINQLVDRVEEIILRGNRSNGRKFCYRYDMELCVERLIKVYACAAQIS